jgi:hypothetical protein
MNRPMIVMKEIETAPGENLRLKAQVVQLRLPFFNAVFTWNRPAAVVVSRQGGEEVRLPVVDVTRLVLIGLAVVSLAAMVVLQGLSRQKRGA